MENNDELFRDATDEEVARAKGPHAEGVDRYDVTGPDCHNKPPSLQVRQFRVDPNRFIYRVEQHHVSGPGPWSYNPDGGYDIWYRIQEGGTRAEWRRLHTSHPVTYQVLVYWRALGGA